MQTTHVSEVAAIREHIAAEHMAAKLALQGLNVGTARHSFITARQENIGALHEQLQDLVGDEAIALVSDTLEAVPDIPTRVFVLAAFQHSFTRSEEVERFCNALQEAWKALDLLQERLGGEQALMNLESLAAFSGVDLLRERFGDEQAHKLIFAPSTARREIPPS